MKALCLLTKLATTLFAILIIAACGSTDNQATEPTDANKALTASQTKTSDERTKNNNRDAKQQILNYAKADKDYIALVAKFKREEGTSLDFDAIVRIYPLTSNYSPYANVEQAQKLLAFESMEQQNWEACLTATSLILEENYTSLTGHYGAMVCHSELGQSDLSQYHNVMLDGFMDAIWRSGDGKTPASAFYITSSNDLYSFVQLNGLMATSQSLVYYEQRPIDAIRVENPQTMQESTWYFDVTAQFRRGIFDDIESRK
jgi:hypothetical protein